MPRFDKPPAPPFKPGFWRSPVRGPWLTAVFGAVLLFAIPVMFVTGLLSYASYNPDHGHNDTTPDKGLLGFFLFDWPTEPQWLYQVTQSTHVILGLVLVPVLLGKLWSVIPKLFHWPPITSPAQALERLSLLLLVGGAVFEFVTGILNIQYYYIFPGSFYRLHYYGAWVFVSAFVAHVVIKLPILRRALHSRSLHAELRTDLAHTTPESDDDTDLVSTNPARPTISRRGVLGLVGASSLTIFAVTVGQSIGGPLRHTALLAPRGADPGTGPNGFQINKRAAEVGITPGMTGAAWRLIIDGAHRVVLSRPQLRAMTQHTADLPIACVEGWATENQAWTGVRLRDLATLVGMPRPGSAFVQSLEQGGFGSTTLLDNQIQNGDSLLALVVNGADLSLDHGFPARVIVPDNPGVHNTKWVTSLRFHA